MMDIRLLFLGIRSNGCRMAGAWVRRHAVHGVCVTLAAIEPDEDDPLVDEVLAEAGLPRASEASCRSIADLAQEDFDLVVPLCPEAAAQLPLLPGNPVVVAWNLPDPASLPASDEVRRAAWRHLRDALGLQVAALFDHGYLAAFSALREQSAQILDSVSDGVLVHDLQRRIVLFNRAAEAITGRRRADVIGRDCHTVFGCGFCGGKCVLERGLAAGPDFAERCERLEITTSEGDPRTVDLRIRPLRDTIGRSVGLVAVFHDITREFTLAKRMGELQSFAGIIGRDIRMREVFELIRDVADSTVPILIRGESGTGKELVAAAIHNEGPRAGKPFIAVNCGALPEGLLESELFGHVRGSFTGAIRDQKGRFELAHGGTIFLDEIGDISPAMQVRLLRVLQEGVMQRVGSETPIRVDVRVISATHRDLQKEMAAARFREDLFYRLNVVPIWIPPLRDRLADIPLLVDHLLTRFLAEMGRTSSVHVSPEAMDLLLGHAWPGNVRELQNWLQYALVKCRGAEIRPEHLPPAHGFAQPAVPVPAPIAPRVALTLERVREALAQCQGNRREAARVLGIGRATLYRFFDAHPELLAP